METFPPDMYRITEDWSGHRLDRVVSQWNPKYSRTFWQRQIGKGRIRLNGRVVKAATIVQEGDVITVEEIPQDSAKVVLVPTSEDTGWIVYQDDDLLIVNKPRGLVVHPSPGHEDDSVVQRLLRWLPVDTEDFRPGVVHRLDRDTTGLLILARTQDAKARLSEMIQKREVRRDYIAVVHGHMTSIDGVIDAPIGRHPQNRLKMAVVNGGRNARTRYSTLAVWENYSLLRLTLETGRTHQIRVHLSAMGHPIAGDPLYGPAPSKQGPGQLLHAMRMAFVHPLTDVSLCFWVDPPLDWRNVPLANGKNVSIVADDVFGIGFSCPPLSTPDFLRHVLGFTV